MKNKTYNVGTFLKAANDEEIAFLVGIQGRYEIATRPFRTTLRAVVLDKILTEEEAVRIEAIYARNEVLYTAEDAKYSVDYLSGTMDATAFLESIGKKPAKKMNKDSLIARADHMAARIMRESKTA